VGLDSILVQLHMLLV